MGGAKIVELVFSIISWALVPTFVCWVFGCFIHIVYQFAENPSDSLFNFSNWFNEIGRRNPDKPILAFIKRSAYYCSSAIGFLIFLFNGLKAFFFWLPPGFRFATKNEPSYLDIHASLLAVAFFIWACRKGYEYAQLKTLAEEYKNIDDLKYKVAQYIRHIELREREDSAAKKLLEIVDDFSRAVRSKKKDALFYFGIDWRKRVSDISLNSVSVPKDLFSRVNSLIEIADAVYCQLNNFKEKYRRKLSKHKKNLDLSLFKDIKKQPTFNQVVKAISVGTNINTKDQNGYTPLMYAVVNGLDVEIVALLINAGADVNANSSKI